MKGIELVKEHGEIVESYCLGHNGFETVNSAKFKDGTIMYYEGNPIKAEFMDNCPSIERKYPGGKYRLV